MLKVVEKLVEFEALKGFEVLRAESYWKFSLKFKSCRRWNVSWSVNSESIWTVIQRVEY